jgi:hypothetical protein
MAHKLSEQEIRRRALHGWAFRKWTLEQETVIKAFLNLESDEVPPEYTAAYRVVQRQEAK